MLKLPLYRKYSNIFSIKISCKKQVLWITVKDCGTLFQTRTLPAANTVWVLLGPWTWIPPQPHPPTPVAFLFILTEAWQGFGLDPATWLPWDFRRLSFVMVSFISGGCIRPTLMRPVCNVNAGLMRGRVWFGGFVELPWCVMADRHLGLAAGGVNRRRGGPRRPGLSCERR